MREEYIISAAEELLDLSRFLSGFPETREASKIVDLAISEICTEIFCPIPEFSDETECKNTETKGEESTLSEETPETASKVNYHKRTRLYLRGAKALLKNQNSDL